MIVLCKKDEKKISLLFLPFSFLLFLATMEGELFDACDNNNITLVKEILNENPTLDINWKNPHCFGCSALYRACQNGHVDIVQLLMAHPDIDINQKSYSGWVPFMSACYNGHPSIVRMMLEDPRLTTINYKDDIGWTPLSNAAFWGNLEVIKWMIASGRELDLGQEDGWKTDAIKQAREGDQTEIVSLLERFKEDEDKTRREIKRKLGLYNELAADLFSLTVLRLHGQLQIKINK
jgi:hypothetical protein